MLSQGVLGFQYDAEPSAAWLTALAGLLLYLELMQASGLTAAIREHVHVAGEQGWLDVQMVLALLLLDLAGGDCAADLDRLEHDSGFAAVLTAIERELLTRRERQRAVPLVSTITLFDGSLITKSDGLPTSASRLP